MSYAPMMGFPALVEGRTRAREKKRYGRLDLLFWGEKAHSEAEPSAGGGAFCCAAWARRKAVVRELKKTSNWDKINVCEHPVEIEGGF